MKLLSYLPIRGITTTMRIIRDNMRAVNADWRLLNDTSWIYMLKAEQYAMMCKPNGGDK